MLIVTSFSLVSLDNLNQIVLVLNESTLATGHLLDNKTASFSIGTLEKNFSSRHHWMAVVYVLK
jgi:hypothetical protein